MMDPSSTTNVLDMTGINNLMARLYVANYGSSAQILMTVDVYYFLQGRTTPIFKFISNVAGTSSNNIFPASSGKILQIGISNAGSLNNVYWSLNLVRINT